MKYLAASGLSALFYLAINGPSIEVNIWQKLLYNKETPKEKRKKEYKRNIIIWAVFTIVMFVFVVFFID